MKKITYQAWYSFGEIFKAIGPEHDTMSKALEEAEKGDGNSIVIREYATIAKNITIVKDVHVMNMENINVKNDNIK